MPAELVIRKFDAACLPSLGAFDCGQDQFGKKATDWIRCVNASDCAIQAMRDRDTEVYLYSTPAGQLVGFGSLGKTKRKVKRVEEEWSIIPHVGIGLQFRGCPKGVPWQDRYAASIMLDLMDVARDHHTPTLLLYVHQDNGPARTLYRRLGFIDLPGLNQAGNVRMIIQNNG